MTDANQPKPKISALALAKRSSDITVVFTAEDVRRFRPAWSGPEAEYFLHQHKKEIGHALIEVGLVVLAKLIESHEQEASS